MDRITISDSLHTLENFLQALDNAYWEASTIETKDVLYDLISILHIELNELAKLSVEDLYMAYEPITLDLRNSISKLKRMQVNMHDWAVRSKTARHLETELPNVINLLNPQN